MESNDRAIHLSYEHRSPSDVETCFFKPEQGILTSLRQRGDSLELNLDQDKECFLTFGTILAHKSIPLLMTSYYVRIFVSTDFTEVYRAW